MANIGLLGRDGLLERGRELEQPLLDVVKPLASHALVSEVRGGVGLLAAVELDDDLLQHRPDAVALLAAGARARGVLVRTLGRAVAVSPPLTVETDHLSLIADAIDHGLAALEAGGVATAG